MGEAQSNPTKTFKTKVILLKKNQLTKSITILLKIRKVIPTISSAFYRIDIRNWSLEAGYEGWLKPKNSSKNIGLAI